MFKLVINNKEKAYSKELSDNSWIVVINAANLNIANYVKKEINKLLKKDDDIIDYDRLKEYYWGV